MSDFPPPKTNPSKGAGGGGFTIPRCLTCKHCVIDSGWCGTEVTPGDPAEWRCTKGKWEPLDNATDHMYSGKEEVIKAFTIGETCELWESDKRT